MKMYNFRNRKKNISKYMKKVTQALVILAFSTIALVVAILNLVLQNYIIGSLWVLIFLTEYQSKQKRK